MTAALTTPTHTPVLPVGALIEKQVGRTAIRLQRVTADVWTVVVEVGGFRVEDACSSWDDEVNAALTASAHFQMALAEQVAAEVIDHAAALKPGEVRTHPAGATEFKVFQSPTGYLVQVRRDGVMVPDLCRHEPHEIRALGYYAQLIQDAEVSA